MTRLGIEKKLQGRIIGFFTTYGRWRHPGPMQNWIVQDFVMHYHIPGALLRMKNCGLKSIEAMERVLNCVGVTFEK